MQYRSNGTGDIRQFNMLANPGGDPAPLQMDPFMQNLLALVPAVGNSTSAGDTLNTTGYKFNARDNNRRDSIIGKVDYNLSPKHVFSGTYRWNRDIVDRPDIGTFYTLIPPVANHNRAHLFSGSWRWSPGATLTNEFRGGGNIARAPFDVTGASVRPGIRLKSRTLPVPTG